MKTRRRNRDISGDRLTTPRRSTRAKASENSLPVPIDLIFEIFSRLTLKSIARCRCVSKLWSSILRLPDFTELFFTRSSSRPKLSFACQNYRELFIVSANEPQNPHGNSSPVVASYHMKFSFDGELEFCGLVHGLICCLVTRRKSKGKNEIVTVICNPIQDQVLTLPEAKGSRFCARSLVGYDPINKHFKVLSMTRLRYGVEHVVTQVMTLDIKDVSWRRIECCSLPFNTDSDICIDGVVYYRSFNTDTNSYFIVCFDVRSEKFSFIEPKETLIKAVRRGDMINYNGRLGLCQPEGSPWIDGNSTSLKFLVLEDLEKEVWSEHEYLLPALWKDLAQRSSFTCVGVTRENEIVLSPSYSHLMFYLMYFNHERNTMVKVDIQGIDAFKYNTVHTFLYHVEDVKLM